jgi:hypothetical protein
VHAEVMNQHVVPQLATKTDLDNAVIELKSEFTNGLSGSIEERAKGTSDLQRAIDDLKRTIDRSFWQLTLAMVMIAAIALVIGK